jgi:cell division transport system permease protein
MSRARFVFSEIGSGLRRNVSMSVAVVLVTFVSLTFVGAAALLQVQIGNMKDEWYDKVEVSIFLCPADSTVPTCAEGEVTQEQMDAVEGVLQSDALAPYVQTIFTESKQEAFDALQEQMAGTVWAESVTVDLMQVSYRVKLTDPEQYQVVADAVTGRPGVESVRDQRQILEPLFVILNRATLLSVGLAVVMIVAAILLITTTIRLSAMSRRRETGIMRLVGASNLFIQLPFMLEGAIAALIGSLLAVTGLYVGVRYLVEDWLQSSLQWVNLVTTQDVLEIAPWLILISIGLAAISSLVTLRRYTRV